MDLVALEEIKRLKHRYLRCVDTKDWDGLAETLAVDATADYGTPVYGGPLHFASRDALVAFLSEKLGAGMTTTHFATQPEIDIDDAEATGRWAFQDTVIVEKHRTVIAGAAYYEDRYRRDDDGRWRITHTGYERLYEAMWSLDDLPSFRLTANRWAVEQVTSREG